VLLARVSRIWPLPAFRGVQPVCSMQDTIAASGAPSIRGKRRPQQADQTEHSPAIAAELQVSPSSTTLRPGCRMLLDPGPGCAPLSRTAPASCVASTPCEEPKPCGAGAAASSKT